MNKKKRFGDCEELEGIVPADSAEIMVESSACPSLVSYKLNINHFRDKLIQSQFSKKNETCDKEFFFLEDHDDGAIVYDRLEKNWTIISKF